MLQLLQVYAVALYVEALVARKELRRLQHEGFFKKEGYTDDTLTSALNMGRFRKCLQIQMLRSASGGPAKIRPRQDHMRLKTHACVSLDTESRALLH